MTSSLFLGTPPTDFLLATTWPSSQSVWIRWGWHHSLTPGPRKENTAVPRQLRLVQGKHRTQIRPVRTIPGSLAGTISYEVFLVGVSKLAGLNLELPSWLSYHHGRLLVWEWSWYKGKWGWDRTDFQAWYWLPFPLPPPMDLAFGGLMQFLLL